MSRMFCIFKKTYVYIIRISFVSNNWKWMKWMKNCRYFELLQFLKKYYIIIHLVFHCKTWSFYFYNPKFISSKEMDFLTIIFYNFYHFSIYNFFPNASWTWKMKSLVCLQRNLHLKTVQIFLNILLNFEFSLEFQSRFVLCVSQKFKKFE